MCIAIYMHRWGHLQKQSIPLHFKHQTEKCHENHPKKWKTRRHLCAASQLHGCGRVKGRIFSATILWIARSMMTGCISKNHAIYTMFAHVLNMRVWTGLILGHAKTSLFFHFQSSLVSIARKSMPATFHALWVLHPNWKSKSSSLAWVLCLLLRVMT